MVERRISHSFRACFIFSLCFVCVTAYANAAGVKTVDLSAYEWSVYFDESGKATPQQVSSLDKSKWQSVNVGSCWQDQGLKHPLAGTGKSRIAWYKCVVKIPAGLEEKNLKLQLGAVDDLDSTYVNGKLVGSTGQDTPAYWQAMRLYPVPAGLLRKGADNEILVRVTDLRGKGGMCGMPVRFICMVKKEQKMTFDGFNPLHMPMYDHAFEVEFASEKDAKNAKLEVLPLPAGKTWAFTGRWDDNNASNVRMRELMDSYGFKATFYLNSMTRSRKTKEQGEEYIASITKNGFSVGGHSMTHPMLQTMTRDEMFYEVMQIRAELESLSNSPVNSYAFSYGAFSNPFDNAAQVDIARLLIRSGYHHNTYAYFITKKGGMNRKMVSSYYCVYPGDREPDMAKFDRSVASAMSSKSAPKIDPAMSLGVHVWHTDSGFEKMAECLDKYKGRADWWYCNQTEYAAYRYQFHNSEIKDAGTSGKVRKFVCSRPIASALGEDVGLDFAISGATPVKVSGKSVSLVDGKDGAKCVRLDFDVAQSLPARIDEVRNFKNLEKPTGEHKSGDFPGVCFFAHYNESADELVLTCSNSGAEAVKSAVATLRLPVRYKGIGKRVELGDFENGASKVVNVKLERCDDFSRVADGRPYFDAEVDFVYGGKPARIHATVRGEAAKDRAPGLHDVARLMGPVPVEEVESLNLAELSKPGTALENGEGPNRQWFVTPEGDLLRYCGGALNLCNYGLRGWHSVANKLYKEGQCVVVVSAEFDAKTAGKIRFMTKQKISASYLNGKAVASGKPVEVKQGKNRLVFAFVSKSGKPSKMIRTGLVNVTPLAGVEIVY